MNDVRLVIPSKEHEREAFEYLEEFVEHDSSNNGILENEIYREVLSQVIQRYWVDL